MSGGGGWGAKQGLLSLDPQTTYKTVNEARFDFSSVSLEEQQASALGNIAHPNAVIQFFLANGEMISRPLPDTFQGNEPVEASQKRTYADMFQTATVFGAVPSTVDIIPTFESPASVTTPGDSIEFRKGLFGAVSESGMYYDSTVPKDIISGEHVTRPVAISTKIDLPYSYLFRDYEKERSLA